MEADLQATKVLEILRMMGVRKFFSILLQKAWKEGVFFKIRIVPNFNRLPALLSVTNILTSIRYVGALSLPDQLKHQSAQADFVHI